MHQINIIIHVLAGMVALLVGLTALLFASKHQWHVRLGAPRGCMPMISLVLSSLWLQHIASRANVNSNAGIKDLFKSGKIVKGLS